MKKICFICLMFLSAFGFPPKRPTVWLIGDSTMSVKDVHAYPETGWGMPFAHFFDSTITVSNHAKNGRSTRTFIEEGLWKPVVENLKEGDYVFIQFGHNDEVETKKSYTTKEQFAANLERYVAESRAKGAIPVLLTPVARRKFDSGGRIVSTHEVYSALVRDVAKKNNVPLIDLDAKSQALLQEMGVGNSKYLFNHLKAGEHPNYPEGKIDDTHFSEMGARKMAQLVLAEMRTLKLPLAEHIYQPSKNKSVLFLRRVLRGSSCSSCSVFFGAQRTRRAHKEHNGLCLTTALLFFVAAQLNAQSTVGITNIPDTSYTTYAAWNNIRKAHPDAKAVPELQSKAIREKRGIVYCQTGKRKLLIDAFYPSEKAKRNGIAVLIIYGGGWRSGSRAQHYPLAQHLAALGYVCFTPEYRLSTEALYPAAVHDLKAALRWVHKNAKQYGLNTTKIAVAGFSAGGQLAALLGTTNGVAKFEGAGCESKQSSNVQAIVDLDGTLSFVHPESGEGDDSKKTSAATYWFGYSKKENIKLWEEASPLTHVNKHTPPTLFINSSVARMHAGRDDFIKVLKENKVFVDVETFADAPHHFPLFEPWFTPMVGYIDGFLKKVFQ